MKTTLKIMLLPFCLGFFLAPATYAQKRLLSEAINGRSIVDKQGEEIENNLRARAKSASIKFFNFDKAALSEASIEIEVEKGKKAVFVIDETDSRGPDDFTWHGHISGSQGGSAVFVYLNGELSGQIIVGNKKYALMPFRKGVVSFYEMNDGIYPPDHPNLEDGQVPGGRINYAPASPSDAYTCRVRVLVAYTNSAKTGAAGLGYSDVKLFIQQAIAETNQSFINSQVTHRIELAVALNVSYTESGSYDTDLSRFVGTADGYMDNVHAYRNAYRADLCALIFNNSAYCGLANAIGATASQAFCVVHYSCVLGNYSFGHELAHLYGCRHNTEVDGSTTPYAYGHGYVYVPGGWRTIMAYNDAAHPTTRIQYWSNPNVTYGGVAMGTAATNNNARVLNTTASSIAAFSSIPAVVTLNATANIGQFEVGDALATTQVVLSPGFISSNGSIFHASVGNCSGGFRVNEESAGKSQVTDNVSSKGVDIKLYPNPTSGVFNLDLLIEGQKTIKVALYNVLGQDVFNKDLGVISELHLPLDITQDKDGLYVMRIQADNEVITKQLILIK